MDHLFHPWHWAPVLVAAPVIAAWWATFRHRAALWAPWTTSPTQEVTMDEATKQRENAETIVQIWFRCLTDPAQAMISDHDLEALIATFEATLIEDPVFLAEVAKRKVELDAEIAERMRDNV